MSAATFDVRSNVRESEIHLVSYLLHGRDDHLAEAVFCVGAFGHDVGFERDFAGFVGRREGELGWW